MVRYSLGVGCKGHVLGTHYCGANTLIKSDDMIIIHFRGNFIDFVLNLVGLFEGRLIFHGIRFNNLRKKFLYMLAQVCYL